MTLGMILIFVVLSLVALVAGSIGVIALMCWGANQYWSAFAEKGITPSRYLDVMSPPSS